MDGGTQNIEMSFLLIRFLVPLEVKVWLMIYQKLTDEILLMNFSSGIWKLFVKITPLIPRSQICQVLVYAYFKDDDSQLIHI